MRFFLGGFWATGEPRSAKSDQFWVDIFKPKWNLSYIDGDRLRGSEEDACVIPLYYHTATQGPVRDVRTDQMGIGTYLAHDCRSRHNQAHEGTCSQLRHPFLTDFGASQPGRITSRVAL